MKRKGTEANDNHKIKRVEVKILSTPTKSFSDKKEYRLMKLPNGLMSLLASDMSVSVSSQDGEEKSTKGEIAAVALCVKVGSFYDPHHIQGLSHFVEHMIFMGSKKFPKENEFDQFIKTNGGNSNATTHCEYTIFHFEIFEDHLEGAIDRFAQLLIDPLMLRDSMEREMKIVESEFQNSIADDDSRIMQLCASLANGPAGNFTWGNLKTLKEGISSDNLYSAVHNFRREHYFANRMYLCVDSVAPLDELQKLVQDNFSSVISGPDQTPLVFPDPIFKPEFCEKVFYVKPKADKSKLYMTFLLPPMDKHYESKAHDYLAFIIQHEGIGSLSSFLKKKLLALRVKAGAEDKGGFKVNSMFTLFSINVTLTEAGFKHIDEVLDAIFSFLLVLKATSIAEHEKAFKELQRIKETSFKYREERFAVDNVEELAVNMMYYDCKDIITGSNLFFEFNSGIVEGLIERLIQKNFNILILTDKHEKYEKKEKWFGTEYDEIDFPEAFTVSWNNRKVKPEFSFPLPNEFICIDFDIISKDLEPGAELLHPSKVFDSNGCECFYMDARFKLPRAYIEIYLVSQMTISSVRGTILTSLYLMIVKHYMSEKLYPAVCAGLRYQLLWEKKGLHLTLSGYNEKLPLLLDFITKGLKNIGQLMEKEVFEAYRGQYKKNCYSSLISSEFLNKDCLLNIVEADHKSIYDRMNDLAHLTIEELVKFASDFLKKLKVQILVLGNISKEKAVEIGKCVVENLKCNEIDKGVTIESCTRKLPVGNNVLQVKSVLPNDKTSTTTNYIQIGPSSIRTQCLIDFIEKIMKEPLVNILRTQKTLGYSVLCSHLCNNGILGISVTVQSQEDKNSTVVVCEWIEKFLDKNMLEILEKLSDEEFTTIQTALKRLKNSDEANLELKAVSPWSEITSNEYIFNRLSLEGQMIAQITKQDVLNFYKTKVIASDARKLSIQVIGSEVQDEGHVDEENVPKLQILNKHKSGQKPITSMSAFVDSLDVYPVTKTVIDL